MKRLFRRIYDFFFPKMICGKTYIDESMTAKWGSNWLDDCLEGLKNPEVRSQLRKDLGLKANYEY